MSKELVAELKATNDKLDKVADLLLASNKQDSANDNVPADDVTPTDEPVVPDATPDAPAPNDVTPTDEPSNDDEPTDGEPTDNSTPSEGVEGTDDDDPEIDPENVTEDQAKAIAAATKAAIDAEMGKVN